MPSIAGAVSNVINRGWSHTRSSRSVIAAVSGVICMSRIVVRLLSEASKLVDESLKAEIEKEIEKVIWVILGLASWKASKSKKVASPC